MGELLGTFTEAEGSDALALVRTGIVAVKACLGKNLTWFAASLVILSLVGLLFAAPPAGIFGPGRAFTYALGRSLLEIRFAGAEVLYSNLLVTGLHCA